MRRLLAACGIGLALLVAVLQFAPGAKADDPFFGGAEIAAYRSAVTGAGNFGAPRYTTALLPTCGTTNKGAIAFDTTAAVPKVCDGSTWTALGGLSSPVSGDYVWTGKATFGSALDATNTVRLGDVAGSVVFEGTANAFETILDATDPTVGDTTLHLPNLGAATSDTLAALAATQTFTNKTLTAPTINGTVATTGLLLPTFDLVNADTTITRSAAGLVSVEGVDLVNLSATQTLTNKTLTAPAINGTVTTAGLLLPTHDIVNADTTLTRSAAGILSVEGVDLVTLSATQSLTNKTLTSPIVSGGTIQGTPKFISDAILYFGTAAQVGFTWSTWTPNNFRIGVHTTDRSIAIMDLADLVPTDTDNCIGGTGAYSNPALTIFSTSPGTASVKCLGLWHDAVNAHLMPKTGGVLGLRWAVEANTASKTPTAGVTEADESGEVYTNTGDSDGSTITLPNDPAIGVPYRVAVTVAQTITIAPNTGEHLYFGSDECLVSITSNTVGSFIEFVSVTSGSGAFWLTTSHEGSFTCNDI